MKLQELRRFTKIMKSYERTQVLYFCVEVINVRIEVVYNVTSMRYVNKCRIFVNEVLLTQTAPHTRRTRKYRTRVKTFTAHCLKKITAHV